MALRLEAIAIRLGAIAIYYYISVSLLTPHRAPQHSRKLRTIRNMFSDQHVSGHDAKVSSLQFHGGLFG